jgi:CheY-like chemotaxis protein/anti-sigma regulatory factor (Ser/Thr protein kinase)
VGTLAAGVAHDFSNVITSICGCIEAARPEVSPGSKPALCLDQIHGAATQASRISRELLTFARKSHAEKTSENLGELVQKSLNMLRHAVPSSIEVVPCIEDPERLWIRANATQIQQVLLNLTLNARDAMPEGGCLRIRVSPLAREKCILLEVRDTGEGFPEEIRQRVFEPFYSTKPREEGTGLGMAVVHGIVTDHGGSIDLESVEGEGATVRIRLPRQDPPSSGGTGPSTSQIPSFRGEGHSVLLAEGSTQVRAILASLLSATGLHVIQVTDTDELREALAAHAQGDPVVVFDPNLCSGGARAFLDGLRRVQPGVRVVVVVGDSAPDLQASESDHVVLIRKPFPAATLLSAVKRLLDTSSKEATKNVVDSQ